LGRQHTEIAGKLTFAMTTPRLQQVSLDDTPYYHCVARCVRRAFLCGEDRYSGRNFDHRRQWIVDRIKLEASVFAIDICTYAIMSNHYHLVLRVDRKQAEGWSDDEVIERWCRLFKGPVLIHNYLAGHSLSSIELGTVGEIAGVWRKRLMSLSWFMRYLNEYIAREANREDHCKGRFWEGRFKSQALLDCQALLACMAYVDLNPIRAGLCETLASSDFTSIQERLISAAGNAGETPGDSCPAGLLPFSGSAPHETGAHQIPFPLQSYIDLVEFTGRVVRTDKSGAIPAEAPHALDQLGLRQEQWLALALTIQRRALRAIGSLDAVERYNHSRGSRWLRGHSDLAALYNSG
jgi:REP element-mobilizing transposase RayT